MSFGGLPANIRRNSVTGGGVQTKVSTYKFGGGGIEGTVTYTQEWRGDLLLPELARAVIWALRQTIKLGIEVARSHVPIDTRRLHDSIRSAGVTPHANGLTGRMTAGGITVRGVYVSYAVWQEIGTRFNSAKHYMLRGGNHAAPFFWAFLLQKFGGI